MKLPLITISIPVYNCEKYIERCINSVFAQTYPNIEILLVDDKGKDNSMEIVREIALENPQRNIRIIENETNRGLSVVRNAGIDNAKGEFLFFLDSDDEITPDCIEKLYEVYEKTGATVVVSLMKCVDTSKNQIYDNHFPIEEKKDFIQGNNEILKTFCANGYPVTAPNKLLKVSFFRENNLKFVEGLYSQDELWSFHTALKLDSIAFYREFTYLYYFHAESTIFTKGKKNFENHQTIAEYFAKAYKEETNAQRKKWILRHIIHFKELTLFMQWRFMKNDITYWKQNYSRLKKLPSLSPGSYFSKDYPKDFKKKNFFQNLPTEIGFRLFKWRYERGGKN